MSDKTTTAYWHGGVPGLKPGDILQPGHNRKLRDLLDALEKAEGHRDSLAATLIEVQRERLGLEAAVERVRALHGLCRTCDPAREPHCDCCGEDWPCLTISALHGGE